jgi:hypothetical protein
MPAKRAPTLEERLDALVLRLNRLAEHLGADLDQHEDNGLRCVECGRRDDGERGWTLRLDVDDDLAAFCPACDAREFGDSR